MSTLVAEQPNRLLWERVLDRLELDVVRTEELLAGGDAHDSEPWMAPKLEGPIPADLLPRARELHRRQREAQRRLEQSLQDVRQQQAFTDKVDRAAGKPAAAPRFVDVSA